MADAATELQRYSTARATGVTEVRVFLVTLDAGTDDWPSNARTVPGVSLGDAHPEVAGAKCVSIDARPVDFKNIRRRYTVTVEYQTPQYVTPAADPVNDPVQISFGNRTFTRVVLEDRDGSGIGNSVGDSYDPPYEIEMYDIVIQITRNEATMSASTMREYLGTTNNAGITVAGFSIGTRRGLLTAFAGQSLYRNGFTRYTINYEIQIASENWDVRLKDEGLRYLSGGKKKPIMRGGAAVTTPERLDGAGGELAENAGLDETEFNTFRIRGEKSWAALSLPSTL